MSIGKSICNIYVKNTISVFSVSQGSAEALTRWDGKYSIFWLLAFSVIFLPNIMKIWQCFRVLQLKTSGIFFETVQLQWSR